MHVIIAAVGRLRAGPLADLAADYRKRITATVDIREVEERRKLPPAELMDREGVLLLGQLRETATVVALDPAGQDLDSEQFASRIETWASHTGRVAFVIGGANGLDKKVLTHAQHRMSLGAMTWPHMLARVMLLEQIYRAQQIRAGHPYHRR
ncbi:MAG: 23S rRNA (pseudouridine(1915)-N(3))-methyltransferase RlmH [Alphaproteobacteria bacterium]